MDETSLRDVNKMASRGQGMGLYRTRSCNRGRGKSVEQRQLYSDQRSNKTKFSVIILENMGI